MPSGEILPWYARGSGIGVFDAAFDRHGPEARRRRSARRSRASTENTMRLAVGRPSLHDVGAGMPRQALRLAALGGHDVDVDVAAVLAR